jgi:hypothetical protein
MHTGQRAHRCVACEPWPRRGCLGTSPPSSAAIQPPGPQRQFAASRIGHNGQGGACAIQREGDKPRRRRLQRRWGLVPCTRLDTCEGGEEEGKRRRKKKRPVGSIVRKRDALVIRMRVRGEGAVARKVGNTLSASDTPVHTCRRVRLVLATVQLSAISALIPALRRT